MAKTETADILSTLRRDCPELNVLPVCLPRCLPALDTDLLHCTDMPASLAGALFIGTSHHRILINARQAMTRQRFTLAHEIGHLLLHARSGRVFVLFRPQINLALEREASHFGAQLLMPEDLLREAAALTPSFDSLRVAFAVSKRALSRRLAVLDIVVARTFDAPTTDCARCPFAAEHCRRA